MIDSNRFEKLEDKVERVREDVSELKSDLKAHIIESKHNMIIVKEHVAGDKKIINAIEPLLAELPDLVEIIKEYQFEKEKKKKITEKLNNWKLKLTVLSVALGLLTAIVSHLM